MAQDLARGLARRSAQGSTWRASLVVVLGVWIWGWPEGISLVVCLGVAKGGGDNQGGLAWELAWSVAKGETLG